MRPDAPAFGRVVVVAEGGRRVICRDPKVRRMVIRHMGFGKVEENESRSTGLDLGERLVDPLDLRLERGPAE